MNIIVPEKRTYFDKNKKEKTINCNPYDMKVLRLLLKGNEPEWMNIKCPSHLVDQAIKEACTAFKSNVEKIKKIHIPFDLKYKIAKNKIQTIKIDSPFMSKNKNTLFGGYTVDKKKVFSKIRSDKPFYIHGQKMTNLIWNKVLDVWKLCIPINERRKNVNKKYNIASIDPGVRDFNVVYSNNHICKLGSNTSPKLMKICKEIDIIKSRIDRKQYYTKNKDGTYNEYIVNSKRKKNLQKALHRKIAKIKNMVKNLHYKIANYLCKNYKCIILPHFETQKMVGSSYLSSNIARKMYTLSFYQFKTRLIHKANIFKTKILKKSEAYTSKTCTNCGNIKNNLGANKVYNCSKCNIIIDRDFNGARNILLKNFDYI